MLIELAVPLVSVAVIALLEEPTLTDPKLRVDGDADTDPELEEVPVPERATVSGVALAELVMLHVPVRVPAAVGLNAMEAVQWAEAARDEPQGVEEDEGMKSPVIVAVFRVTVLDVPLVTVIV